MATDAFVGTRLGRYLIREKIGAGGMSRVYRAEHELLGTQLAVKILSAELSEDREFRERFLNEARLAARLSVEHPNIARIYDADEERGTLYIAMDYVPEGDLRRLLEHGPIDPDRTLRILAQVADALDFVHRHGLVHGDVKPANVLVTGDCRAFLSDFGIAKDLSDRRPSAGTFAGTVDYAAPEQISGKEVDSRTDVYALGCMLYECLVGTPPFARELDVQTIGAHLNDPPPKVTASRPDLPSALDAVIERSLAKTREGRPNTCNDLVGAARAALESDAAPSEIPGGPDRTMAARTLTSEATTSTASSEAPFRIFVNYRRTDASGYAGRLWDALASHFGPERVFIDIDTIRPGVDFEDVINEAVDASHVVIAVIGKGWLAATDSRGRRRLDDPEDFVRMELTAALERNVRVIPALVGEAEMPPPDDLPDGLRKLARRNALELSDARWRYDVSRLIKTLDELERERTETARLESERVEQEAAERAAAVRAQTVERERLEREAAERAEAERREREQTDAERLEQARAQRLEQERREQEAAERAQAERLEAERVHREQVEREAKERTAAERALADRLKRERAEERRLEREHRKSDRAQAAERAKREQAERKATKEAAQRSAGQTRAAPAPAVPAGAVAPGAEARESASAGRRQLLLVAAILAVGGTAAAVGFLAGHSGSAKTEARPKPPPRPPSSATASAGKMRLTFPTTWRRTLDEQAVPGVDFQDSIALVPSGKELAAGLTAGTISAGPPAFLPTTLLAIVPPSEAKKRVVVKLGGLQAYRYTSLHPSGFRKALTLYVVPALSTATTIACFARLDLAPRLLRACEGIAVSLSLAGAKGYPLIPSSGYAGALSSTARTLMAERARGIRRLAAAKTQRAQAQAVTSIAGAYEQAARRVSRLAVTPLVADANAAIAAAIGRTARAYASLALAARRGSRGRYDLVRREIAARERALQQTVARLAPLGYAIR